MANSIPCSMKISKIFFQTQVSHQISWEVHFRKLRRSRVFILREPFHSFPQCAHNIYTCFPKKKFFHTPIFYRLHSVRLLNKKNPFHIANLTFPRSNSLRGMKVESKKFWLKKCLLPTNCQKSSKEFVFKTFFNSFKHVFFVKTTCLDTQLTRVDNSLICTHFYVHRIVWCILLHTLFISILFLSVRFYRFDQNSRIAH